MTTALDFHCPDKLKIIFRRKNRSRTPPTFNGLLNGLNIQTVAHPCGIKKKTRPVISHILPLCARASALESMTVDYLN